MQKVGSKPEGSAMFKAKLYAAAIIAAVLVTIMTVLTLQTTRSASDVEAQARNSYERMRAFGRLHSAAKELQKRTYEVVRTAAPASRDLLVVAQKDFERGLQDIRVLPVRDAHQREVQQAVERGAIEVREELDRAPENMQEVTRLWQVAGYKAAIAHYQVVSTALDEFVQILLVEVFRDSRQFAETTQRSAQSQTLVRTIAVALLVVGLLMTVALFFVLLKRMRLQQANVALAEQDEWRRAFLVDASHELRLPLTIIRGEAQVALRTDPGSVPETGVALERILDQTRTLTRMLDDLFLIARAEGNGLGMHLERVDAGELVTHTAADFSTLAFESGAKVVSFRDQNLQVIGDPDRLRQALAALIDNAIRHTRPGVTIEVSARAEGHCVVLSVSDDGPGIDPATAGELFQRFRRGDTRADGSGLGLAVVRALAEAHGGEANIEAGTAGGARVTLRLPRAPVVMTGDQSRGGLHALATAGGR